MIRQSICLWTAGLKWSSPLLEHYPPNLANMYRRAAMHVGKILKGATPAELPVEQAMKFDLVLNLKTAQALEITFPPTLLVLADEVIR